ncbi:hypothetical protein NIES4071_102130 (plasmid) [Calothrix sp. NIES-4071]|nr:hypothetical protein NIES4071_102130 [Calothrix sp. NIES-4071]BAZ64594.1 hypothetical protein NIES4105_103270 [Calothrix sp. NIES-4105]
MTYNHRNLVRKVNNKLIVDEEKLDIFWKYKRKSNKPWRPHHNIKDYVELDTTIVDIETSGLNPVADRIYAIGTRDQSKNVNILMHLDERKILKGFISLISKTKPEILFTYNGISFDLPFIIKRCEIYGIKHPFKIGGRKIRVSTAIPYGYEPLEVHPISIQHNIEHVDVYICVLRWDSNRRQLSDSKSLKQVPIDMGLRHERRLELEYEEILRCWNEGEGSNGWAQIEKYLRLDLEDTALVASKIVPDFYYEKYIAPNTGLDMLTLLGAGSKWSRGLQLACKKYPEPEQKLQFQGGLAGALTGLYHTKPIAQVDISGMHSWIIWNYGLHSKYDIDEISLAMIEYFRGERERIIAIPELSNRQKALKNILNCYYGLLGTGKLAFNDMVAAALVCAYSRRLLKFMLQIIQEMDATIIEYDTDGIYFMHDDPHSVHQQLIAKLPQGITIKLENFAKAMYVPGNGCKNYLLWTPEDKVVKKGSWSSRAKSKIENEHPIQYLTHFLESYEAAEEYHKSLSSQIQSGNYPIDKLVIRRRIRESEIELLKIGKPKQFVTYYTGVNGICTSGNYSKSYYTQLINAKRAELLQIIAPEKLLGGSVQQLSLF